MSLTTIIMLPFSALLMAFYNLTSSYGLAVILFAVSLKLILLYPQMRSKRSMMRTARLSPIMKELEKKHEGNKAKYNEEVAKLYKEEKINPMSGCLWTMIPIPILFMLYSVIRQPFMSLMHLTQAQVDTITNRLVEMGVYTIPAKADAYSEITLANLVHNDFNAFKDISSKLVDLDFSFLGMNLGARPEWNFFSNVDWSITSSWAPALGLFLIPVVSGLLAYFSMKISSATNPAASAQQQGSMKSMMMIMPFFSVYIGFIMPAALGIYWIANSVLAIIQDTILNKYYSKIMDKEDAERRERMRLRDEELEKKRLETEKLRENGATERNKNTSKKKIQSAQKVENEERLAVERAQEKATRRAELGLSDDKPASQVGNRKYARGRAYVDDRYINPEGAEEATKTASALSDIDEAVDTEYAENTDSRAESTNTDAIATETGEEA